MGYAPWAFPRWAKLITLIFSLGKGADLCCLLGQLARSLGQMGVERVSTGFHLRGGYSELLLLSALFILYRAPSMALGNPHQVQVKAWEFIKAKFKPKSPKTIASYTLLFTCWKSQHDGAVTRNFIVFFQKFINVMFSCIILTPWLTYLSGQDHFLEV